MNYFALLETQATGSDNSAWMSIILLVVLIIVFYFFMIRPQKKQEREANNMRNNLTVGDEITTIGGIIGRVVSIKEETCVIETSRDCTKIRILKTAIKSVDVPASATKGYVAPAASAEKAEKVEEKVEEKPEEKPEMLINGEKVDDKKKKKK